MQRGMEYVLAVCQEHSFSKAAEKLYISQPALSATIRKVEEEAGLELFNRSTTPVSLTDAGVYYVACAQKIALLEQQMRQHFAQLKGERSGSVTIGAPAYFCAYVLPPLVSEFRRLHPEYTVSLTEITSRDVGERLQSGELDLAIFAELFAAKWAQRIPWREDDFVLAVPAAFSVNEQLVPFRLSFEQVRSGSYLEKGHRAVSLARFANEPFVLMDQGSDTYLRSMKMCLAAGFAPRANLYLDQMLTTYYVAKAGNGCAFIRAAFTQYVDPTGELWFYRISDRSAHRRIDIHCKKNAQLSPAGREFLDFLTRN